MDFLEFKEQLRKQMDFMLLSGRGLFKLGVPKETLWEVYNNFPEEADPIYKENKKHDCNACKHFIRRYGDVVTIVDNKIVSMWDNFDSLEYPYREVAKRMHDIVHSYRIKKYFITKERNMGVDNNKALDDNGNVIVFNHLHYKLPNDRVYQGYASIGEVEGAYQANFDVFERSMRELTKEAGEIVLDLINQKSLYRGEEFKEKIKDFLSYKNIYDNLAEEEKENWCWVHSIDKNNGVMRIRNTAIGTLLVDLSNGQDLNTAVSKFESIMAPANYQRPKALITKKMVDNAEKKINELGLQDALPRRFATLDDITVDNVIFVNRKSYQKMIGNVFDELKKEIPDSPKKFDKVEEIDAETFINDIVPNAKNIKAMVQGKHEANFVSLIAPVNKDAPKIFRWNNNFSWAYKGDVTDSMKENVKKAGGNVEGVLRFSIQWNDNGGNENDFDAHCIEPGRNEIFFEKKDNHKTTGNLDVDIINPNGEVAVENITWSDKRKMEEGIYQFFVHNYSHRGGRSGFKAEIEYDGEICSFDYPRELKQNENVMVAKIEFSREKGIKFIESLEGNTQSREIWGITTNKFTPVSSIMFSPNYWDEQKGIGNKHYLFMLEGCKNYEKPRGLFNEFLRNDLKENRKVFEVLGSKMRVEDSENQLSGLGFSSTKRNDLIVKVEGNFNRVLKIKF